MQVAQGQAATTVSSQSCHRDCPLTNGLVDFNVSAPANTTARPQRPAFSAYCSGQGEDTPYSACELLGDPQTPLKVEAKLLLPTVTGNDSNPNIQVSFMHIDLQSQ